MARARNIKPSFFRNPDLADCSPHARLLFIGLWTMADRDGRLEDRPRYIKFELMPSDKFDVDRELDALSERGFIIRYAKNDTRYIQVVNFKKHQNPHVKEAESTIPAPDEHGANTVQAEEGEGQAGLNPESLLLNPETGIPIVVPPQAPETPPEEPKPKTKRKTQISEPFEITDEMYAYGQKQGMDAQRVDEETERFTLYHRSKGSLFLDWSAAWQGWIRRAPEFQRNVTHINGNGRPAVETFNGQPIYDHRGNPTPSFFAKQAHDWELEDRAKGVSA